MVTIHAIRDPHDEDSSPVYGAQHREWYAIAVKGAPDMVLGLCNRYQAMNDREARVLDDAARQRILAANDEMTKDALRVLGWRTAWHPCCRAR
jgi:Ca2+-transporting ATPase